MCELVNRIKHFFDEYLIYFGKCELTNKYTSAYN